MIEDTETMVQIKKLLQSNGLTEHQLYHKQFIEIHVETIALEQYLLFFKDDTSLRFTLLSDLFAADFPHKEKRFEIGYNIFSLKLNQRIIIKTHLNEKDKIHSINHIYSCATWYEREIYDLFGVVFKNNNDKRRLLTDYEFIGHPLRKDFPLSGYVQVTYNKKLEKVIYEPVKLEQEYREFDTVSPWHKNPIGS